MADPKVGDWIKIHWLETGVEPLKCRVVSIGPDLIKVRIPGCIQGIWRRDIKSIVPADAEGA